MVSISISHPPFFAILLSIAQLCAAQSSLTIQLPKHNKKSSKMASSVRQGSQFADKEARSLQRRGSTAVDIVKALRRLIMGPSSKDGISARQANEHEDSHATIPSCPGRDDSGFQTTPKLSTSLQAGRAGKISMGANVESLSQEHSGYESSGGAPSRGITDDEVEDSDVESEALRSSRAGSRRRRTRQVRINPVAMLICDFDNFKASGAEERRQDISPMNDKIRSHALGFLV